MEPEKIIMGNFNTPLLPIGRVIQTKKINKETSELNDTTDQMNLDIYRMFYPIAATYTFFTATHGTFSKINHTLRHKASL
jgi:hypothetical protein